MRERVSGRKKEREKGRDREREEKRKEREREIKKNFALAGDTILNFPLV